MAGDWPLELLVTVTFEEAGGETRLTLRHEGLPVGEQREVAGAAGESPCPGQARGLPDEGNAVVTGGGPLRRDRLFPEPI